MDRRQFLVAGSAGLALPALTLPGPALAQPAWPSRPIELVVPYGAGGGTDVLARALGEALRKHLPQPITVNNKPGASGSIGMADVAGSAADGHKLIMLTVEVTILPHVGIGKVTPDDFTPIARLNFDPSAVTVRAEAPWNTLEEFLDAARKAPGTLRMGHSGPGSIWHVATAALEAKTNTHYNAIPYNGAGPAVLALAGGHLDAVAVSPAEVTTQVQAGRLKTLAVMSEQRVKGFEKVPTLKERGIDLTLGAWRGVAAPKGLPPAIVRALAEAIGKAVQEPGYKDTMDKLNLGAAYADAATWRSAMERDSAAFKALVSRLDMKS